MPDGSITVVFHPASFGKHGHFGGDDASRAAAFVEYANDPRLDAVWLETSAGAEQVLLLTREVILARG